jgi:DnaJ-class molecular chaperone
MKDYYSILGVNKNATEAEIKTAFKKLGLKHHPDKGGDEEKFKEINEAYSTLKDPQKRKQYDNPQSQFQFGGPGSNAFSFDGEVPEGVADLFASMFGRPGGMHRARQKGSDIQLQMPMSLEEIASGVSKTISVTIAGKNEVLNITVPPGMPNGQRVRYKGKGNPGPVEKGDLFIVVNQTEHPRFERSGNDIFSMQEITVWEAIIGTEKELETVNGRKVKYSIKPGSQPETRIKLANQGIQNGHHYVILRVNVPKDLTDSQKQVILSIMNGKL